MNVLRHACLRKSVTLFDSWTYILEWRVADRIHKFVHSSILGAVEGDTFGFSINTYSKQYTHSALPNAPDMPKIDRHFAESELYFSIYHHELDIRFSRSISQADCASILADAFDCESDSLSTCILAAPLFSASSCFAL